MLQSLSMPKLNAAGQSLTLAPRSRRRAGGRRSGPEAVLEVLELRVLRLEQEYHLRVLDGAGRRHDRDLEVDAALVDGVGDGRLELTLADRRDAEDVARRRADLHVAAGRDLAARPADRQGGGVGRERRRQGRVGELDEEDVDHRAGAAVEVD